jgi:glycosyltransferase involved in cell wall biosynthesis
MYLIDLKNKHSKTLSKLSDNIQIFQPQLDGIFAGSQSNQQDTLIQNSALRILYYVEHTSRFDANTGLQRVGRMLAKSLLETGCSLFFVEWCPAQNDLVLCGGCQVEHLSKWNGPTCSNNQLAFYRNHSHQSIRKLFGESFKDFHIVVPEVTHITSHGHPVTRNLITWSKKSEAKISFIFYDDIPLHREELRNSSSVHREYMRDLCHADAIFSISNWSHESLIRFWENEASYLDFPLCLPIPLPAESILAPRQRFSGRKSSNKTILSVGSITPHKNQLMLCHAFNQAQKKGRLVDWNLILVGHCALECESQLKSYLIDNKSIKFINGATDDELRDVYQICDFTVFPSIMEGFGLPIVESIWLGKPCICEKTGSTGEIARKYKGCIPINMSNLEDLQAALVEIEENPSLLDSITGSISDQKLDTWDEYACRISDNLRILESTKTRSSLQKALIYKQEKVPVRIFWLGMHKVLVRTELQRLRSLGMEVFNPPYLSKIVDQSAELNWNSAQNSTLPASIFKELAQTNFFYEEVNSRIADILNTYFDIAIVTISPTWLKTIVNVFEGPIIYRTFGQAFNISQEMNNLGIAEILQHHRSLRMLPHTHLTLDGEASWISNISQPIPYCLTDDVFGYQDSWSAKSANNGDVAITCPNIANPYYKAHYEYIKFHYRDGYFKLFGVQTSQVDDHSVVGTLPRHEQLECFRNLACYLYTYTDKNVCYLPPIEAMVIGVPVLFPSGCLLDRYFGEAQCPGRYQTESEALDLISRIRSNDKCLIQNIINSQLEIRKLYTPSYVWPQFDTFFSGISNNLVS